MTAPARDLRVRSDEVRWERAALAVGTEQELDQRWPQLPLDQGGGISVSARPCPAWTPTFRKIVALFSLFWAG
jgi:hypothetical protein